MRGDLWEKKWTVTNPFSMLVVYKNHESRGESGIGNGFSEMQRLTACSSALKWERVKRCCLRGISFHFSQEGREVFQADSMVIVDGQHWTLQEIIYRVSMSVVMKIAQVKIMLRINLFRNMPQGVNSY